MKTLEFTEQLKEIIRLSEIGRKCLEDNTRLKDYNLFIGDFILVEKTKDIDGIIYNKNWAGRTFVILGILNGNIHVKGINNEHHGYLYIDHVIKYKKLKYAEIFKLTL